MAEENKGTQTETGAPDQQPKTGQEQQPKTFTQEEVNAMMTKEKAQGKMAVLNELGVEDVKNAKDGLKKYQEYLGSQKTELEKAKGETDVEKVARVALENENKSLKFKFEAITLGVIPECVDDITAISMLKVTDGKELSDVVKELKDKPQYKGFFTDGSAGSNDKGNNGTGNNVNGRRKDVSVESIGKRLGEHAAKQVGSEKKSSYFKN